MCSVKVFVSGMILQMPLPEPVSAQSDRRSKIRAVIRVTTGNFLEMYDFMVFGYYAAAIGRTFFPKSSEFASLMLSLALMSVGTLSIACVPGYAVIGLVAPILVVAGRLLQGFSAGVELGSVSVYLSEIATPRHKGFYVS